MKIRNESETIKRGAFNDITKNSESFVYERTLGKEKFVVAINGERPNEVTLPSYLSPEAFEKVLSNYNDGSDFSAAFRPFETRVYKSKKNKEILRNHSRISFI